MNKEEFEKTINELQEKIIVLDPVTQTISDSFLPDSMVAINIMKSRNPFMDTSDIELMITGKATQRLSEIALDNEPPRFKGSDLNFIKNAYRSISRDIDEPVEDFIASEIDFNATDITSNIANNQAPSLKWKGNGNLLLEAKKMKVEVRVALFMAVKEQVDLVQDLIQFAIQFANTIAGAAVLVAPLSFNVPAALSLIMTLLSGVKTIINKILNIIVHLEALKYLKFLLPDESFSQIVAPIVLTLRIFLGFLNAVSTLRGLLGVIGGALEDQSKPEKLKPQKESLQRELDKKVAEQSLFAPDEPEYKSYEDEISGLKQRLASMEKSPQIPKMTVDESGNVKMQDINSLELDPLISGSIKTVLDNIASASEINQNIQSFVYDVYFPDGTIRTDLTEDQINDLKSKYKIEYDPSKPLIVN